MQFGVGLLGRGWSVEQVHDRMRSDTRAAHPNFERHAECYAAKLAAETILAEPPVTPDLSTEGMILLFGGCSRVPRPSEFQMIRDAYNAIERDKIIEVR